MGSTAQHLMKATYIVPSTRTLQMGMTCAACTLKVQTHTPAHLFSPKLTSIAWSRTWTSGAFSPATVEQNMQNFSTQEAEMVGATLISIKGLILKVLGRNNADRLDQQVLMLNFMQMDLSLA